MDQIEEFLLSLDNIYPQIEGYLSTKINYPVKVEIKNKGVKVLEFFNNIVKNYPNNIIENIEFDINEEFLMFKFTSTVDIAPNWVRVYRYSTGTCTVEVPVYCSF